jgi:drug/metabolite transporter (DMT)-like permease
LLGSVAWAAYLVIVKKAKVVERLGALRFTTLNIGAGSLMLLAAAFVSGGAPSLGLRGWLIIAWLSLVNTAFAFYLWNVALKTQGFRVVIPAEHNAGPNSSPLLVLPG